MHNEALQTGAFQTGVGHVNRSLLKAVFSRFLQVSAICSRHHWLGPQKEAANSLWTASEVEVIGSPFAFSLFEALSAYSRHARAV